MRPLPTSPADRSRSYPITIQLSTVYTSPPPDPTAVRAAEDPAQRTTATGRKDPSDERRSTPLARRARAIALSGLPTANMAQVPRLARPLYGSLLMQYRDLMRPNEQVECLERRRTPRVELGSGSDHPVNSRYRDLRDGLATREGHRRGHGRPPDHRPRSSAGIAAVSSSLALLRVTSSSGIGTLLTMRWTMSAASFGRPNRYAFVTCFTWRPNASGSSIGSSHRIHSGGSHVLQTLERADDRAP